MNLTEIQSLTEIISYNDVTNILEIYDNNTPTIVIKNDEIVVKKFVGVEDDNVIELIPNNVILANRLVTYTNSVQYYNANDYSMQNMLLGISLNASLGNTPIRIRELGIVQNDGWNFTTGQTLFAGENGEIVTSFVGLKLMHIIGYAINSNTVFLNPQTPFKLKV